MIETPDSVECISLIGLLYLNGIGVEIDETQAAKFFHLAAKKHDLIAMENLMRMYRDGAGVQKSHIDAEFWENTLRDHDDQFGQRERYLDRTKGPLARLKHNIKFELVPLADALLQLSRDYKTDLSPNHRRELADMTFRIAQKYFDKTLLENNPDRALVFLFMSVLLGNADGKMKLDQYSSYLTATFLQDQGNF